MNETETLQQGALQRLLEVSVHMASSADRQSVLRSIVDAMRDVLRAERATVFELDAATDELVATVAHGIGGPSAARGGEIRLPLGTGLAGECARTRRIINVADTDLDPRFNRDVDVQTGFRTRSILSIPLVDHDRTLVGVAQVLNKHGGPFDEDDVGVAAALASHAAVTLRRSQLIEERLHRQKLLRDLDLARSIQQATLPGAVPQPPGYEIAAWFDPAEETGGDSYDAIDLTDGDGDGAPQRILLLLADATGHGIGPALCATQVRAMVRIAARLGCGLVDTVRHLNEQLHQDLPSGRFVTAWLGVLDASAHELRHFSAGQGPLLHYVAAERRVCVGEPDAPPLGVLAGIEGEPRDPIVLAPGDLFVVTSDGILEARDRHGECFGAERFGDLVAGLAHRPVAEILTGLRERLAAHLGEGRPDDDVTLLVIKRR